MRIVEGFINQDLKLSPLTAGNTAPSLDAQDYVTEQTQKRTHNVQLARQIKEQLSLLEDMHLRMQYILSDVSGIVKRG